MTVRLLDTDNDIVPAAVHVLGFTDREIDRFRLIVAVPDHPAVMINDIPTILGFVVIDMEGLIGTGLARGFGHISDRGPLC